MKKTITILTIILIILFSGLFFINKYYIQSNLPRLKIIVQMFKKSFAELQDEFAKMDCSKLTETEKINGFDGLVTAYCKPKVSEFKNRKDFLCAVGLNCSCPAGRNKSDDCQSSSLAWSSCNDFDENKTAYCDQTADQSSPKAGQVAADWSCFKPGSNIYIDSQKYIVTDKGSAIKGRRFDIWFDNCQDIEKKTGIYNIKLLN